MRCRWPMMTSHHVREGGVEPPRPFGHTDLNRARLPIPPLAPEADVRLSHAVSASQTGRGRHMVARYHRENAATRAAARAGDGHRRGGTVSALQRFENRLEQMISGVFARTFRSAVQPVEIASALNREVDNSAQILSRDRRLVPNDFHVELSEADHQRLEGLGPQLPRELTEMLREHAAQQSYVFTGPVSITLEASDELTTGRFRVRSKAIASSQPGRRRPQRHPGTTSHGDPRAQRRAAPARAARHRDRPRQRRRPAHRRPRRLPQAHRDPRRGAAGPRRRAADHRARPRLDQRDARSTASGSRRRRSPMVQRSGSATRP